MNLLFGVASRHGTGDTKSAIGRVANRFAPERPTIAHMSDHALIGLISDGGAVLGRATAPGRTLVFTGVLNRPLPGWVAGSPVDDPDLTAAFLLRRFEEAGTRFLDDIDGQFALAIYDAEAGRLILATDPNGHRSLFYRIENGRILFSTSLAAITALSPEIELDRSLEDFLLGYEFLPWNRTMFRNVLRLSKGTILVFDESGAANTKTSVSPDAGLEPPCVDESTVVRHLHTEFMHALEALMPSRGPVAVLLGGFDSALIASALVKMGREVETYTFRFAEAGYTQDYTDTLQEFLGHRHFWIDIDPQIIREGLNRFSLCFNQPVGQMHYLIETAHACATIRANGHLHCLTGDGCDEVFLGYPTVHQRAQLFRRLGHLPKPAVNGLSALLRPRFVERRLGHVARLARNVLAILGREMPVRGHISNRVFDAISLDRLRQHRNPPQERDAEEILEELAAGLEHLSPLRLAYHGKSAVGLNKAKVEGCSATTGLTIQSPYQYPRLASFARNLPDTLMRPTDGTASSRTGKHVLMRMAEAYELLPREIIYQKKASPVTAPVDRWYMTELESDLLQSIQELPFAYDKAYVAGLLKHKLAEDLFRKYVGISRYASNAASLLATYASFARYAEDKDGT